MAEFAKKCSDLALNAYVKADMAKDKAKNELSEMANNELGVSGLVVSLILIAIAIALAVIFRGKIADFMDSIFNKAEEDLL